MAQIGKWNGHKFVVSKKQILSFEGLTIKGASETEDKEKDKQQYVKRKNGKPTEVSLTISLNHTLGCDVRAEAMAFVEEASQGKTDYFYVGGKKLVTCKLMLVDATVKEIGINRGTTWISADVQLTMKQCAKGGDSGGSSSGGKKKSKKKSTKSGGTKTPKQPGQKDDEVDAITGAAPVAAKVKAQQTVKQKLQQSIKTATTAIKKIIGSGKKTSAQTKPAPKTTQQSSSLRGRF